VKKVLNVGGNNKSIALPAEYEGWEHVLLDIDPAVKPDVVCDARELKSLEAKQYDAIYCSHNLEHYYSHDVPKVLTGFGHLLADGGFVDICVPDLDAVMRVAVEKEIDIDDVLYEVKAGPITVKDVIYGYGIEIERSGCEYFAHKTGFTPKSLRRALHQCNFPFVYISIGDLEVRAIGFKDKPTPFAISMLRLPNV